MDCAFNLPRLRRTDRSRRSVRAHRWPLRRAATAIRPRPLETRRRENPRHDDDSRISVTRRAGDGASLLAAFRSSVENLAAHVDEVDALNVYPVPDGDTLSL